ncbi:MAG: hypothetical protein WA842_11505, partial [Croceibacterium sp.]
MQQVEKPSIQTGKAYAKARTVVEAFMRQAALHPDAVAARQAGLPPLTYDQLERRSRAVALKLAAEGIGRG